MKVYLNAIQAFVPPQIVKTIAAFLDFCYIARRDVITDDSLNQLNTALHKFHESRQIFSGTVRPDGPSGFSLPRQHSMVHYHNHIKNFGAPNGLCSSITESKHIVAVKRPWRRSNKHKALQQMLRVNERLDKIAAARTDFAARGMLAGSCLIQAIKDAFSNTTHGSDDPMDEDTSDEETSESSEEEVEHHEDEEDDACGPIGPGPLMNEVRLVARKGQSETLALYSTETNILFIAPTREYPNSFDALGLKIGQHNLLDLTRRFLFYQLNPTSTIEPHQLSLAECPMIWDSKVSVYHSATATFRAPSNPSGPGGMYREVIRSTPFWPRGDIPGPRRDCIFVDTGDSENVGMRGLLVARVFLLFRFSYGGVDYPCALVQWYSTSSEPDLNTGLWVARPESTRQGTRHASVIHLDSIVRGAHLLPKFLSDSPVYREINYMNVLDVFASFYVNKYIDHHAFEIAF